MNNPASCPEFTVRYFVESSVASEKIAQVIAGEQSSGAVLAHPGETDELKDRTSARVARAEPLALALQPTLPSAYVDRHPHGGVFHMALARRGDMMRLPLACAVFASGAAFAADVGGWIAEQQKVSMRDAAPSAASSCPQAVARAAADPTAHAAYQAAHCYLEGDSPDLVAGKAWLARSAEMNFLPA